MKKLFLLTILCVCVFSVSFDNAFAESAANAIKEGNRLYHQDNYDDAVQKYLEAKEISPDSDIANFNLGTAYFKKGEYEKSIDAFTRSLNTEDRGIEADATYNIANTKYKLGSELSNSDLNSAADLYRESLDYYKRAIELDQHNTDAKYNHELVEKELKVLLDKIKNQPPPQEGEEQEQKQEGKEEGEEEQQAQSKPEEDTEQQEQQEPGSEQQQDKKGPQEEQAEKQDNGQEEATGPSEEEPGEMSPEEARMLLDAFADEEAMDMKKVKQGRNAGVLKDW